MADEWRAEIQRGWKTTNAILKAEEQGVISRQTALKKLKQASASTGIFSTITDEEVKDAENDPPAPVSEHDEPLRSETDAADGDRV